MDDVQKLKSYADLKRHVSPAAFTGAMNYLAWHNRLKMTPMLPVRQALVVAFLCEKKPIDPMLYRGIKSFLDENNKEAPSDIESCRRLADDLAAQLSGTD